MCVCVWMVYAILITNGTVSFCIGNNRESVGNLEMADLLNWLNFYLREQTLQ